MKSYFKCFRKRCLVHSAMLPLLILMVIIGFSMTACDDGSGDEGGGGGGSASGIETLNLSGKVYLENDNYTSVSYSSYTGANLTIDDYDLGGSGTVTNGNLSYSVGTPDYVYTFDQEDFEDFFGGYDINLSSTNVKANYFYGLGIEDDNDHELFKESFTINVGNKSYSTKYENVYYVYVEDDITVTGTGGTYGPETDEYDGTTYTYTNIYKNFNFTLKAGWNAIYEKEETVGAFTGTVENPTGMTSTSTTTISLSNPSLRWELVEFEIDYPEEWSSSISPSVAPSFSGPEKGGIEIPGLSALRQTRFHRLPLNRK